MKKYPPRHTVGIAITKAQNEQLKQLGKKLDRSVSSIIRELVTRYLKRIK